MSHAKCWQAVAAYPGGGVLTFGVRAATADRALAKAALLAATVPGPAAVITLTRLYGPHHPLHVSGRPAGSL